MHHIYPYMANESGLGPAFQLFSTVTMAVASLLVLLLHQGRPLTRPEDHTANGEPVGNVAAL